MSFAWLLCSVGQVFVLFCCGDTIVGFVIICCVQTRPVCIIVCFLKNCCVQTRPICTILLFCCCFVLLTFDSDKTNLYSSLLFCCFALLTFDLLNLNYQYTFNLTS